MSTRVSHDGVVTLGDLGMDRGAHLLVKRALRQLPVGGRLRVEGSAPALGVHLGAWARAMGHGLDDEAHWRPREAARWVGATGVPGFTLGGAGRSGSWTSHSHHGSFGVSLYP